MSRNSRPAVSVPARSDSMISSGSFSIPQFHASGKHPGARSFASSLTGYAQTEAHASYPEPISAKKMGATINTRSHFEIKRLRRVKSARGKGGHLENGKLLGG